MFGKIKAMFGGGRADETAEDVISEVVADVVFDKKAPVVAPAPAAGTKAGTETPEDGLLAGELRAAQKIQMGLVPKTFPPIPGCLPFDLYAILEPAREIGGDFYDFWLNGRENLVLVIGDVSGKGIPAALFMAVCRTYLRAFSRSIREPARLVEYLNNEVSRHNESCMFVTLLCAVVHLPTGQVTYANAGHNPPFLRKRDGSVSVLEVAEDMPVGFMNGAEFSTRSLKLETGESILFYTDGMPEAFNPRGDVLGDDKSLELFRDSSMGGSCRTAIGQLRAEISEFANGAEQSDDITLMMYAQMDQSGGKINLGGQRQQQMVSDALDGDSGMYSLSNLNEALPRGELPAMDSDLGLSLSGLSGEK